MVAIAANAVTAETARQILDRSMLADGWADRYRRMTLELREKGEIKRTRELELFERREEDNELSTILFFLEPEDVRGIGLLAINHDHRPADQWIYLPAYRRIRPISRSTRDERFVGTDLTYQDLDIFSGLLQWTEEDARSSLLGDESIGEDHCYKIALVPQRDDISYARILLWLSRSDLMPRRIELFRPARSGSLLGGLFGSGTAAEGQPAKRIELGEVRPVDTFPVAHRIAIETPQEQTSTEIRVTTIEFNQKLPDDLFSHRTLERGRR